jgi:hypothetical protein
LRLIMSSAWGGTPRRACTTLSASASNQARQAHARRGKSRIGQPLQPWQTTVGSGVKNSYDGRGS